MCAESRGRRLIYAYRGKDTQNFGEAIAEGEVLEIVAPKIGKELAKQRQLSTLPISGEQGFQALQNFGEREGNIICCVSH